MPVDEPELARTVRSSQTAGLCRGRKSHARGLQLGKPGGAHEGRRNSVSRRNEVVALHRQVAPGRARNRLNAARFPTLTLSVACMSDSPLRGSAGGRNTALRPGSCGAYALGVDSPGGLHACNALRVGGQGSSRHEYSRLILTWTSSSPCSLGYDFASFLDLAREKGLACYAAE